jgi:hypothetical protein
MLRADLVHRLHEAVFVDVVQVVASSAVYNSAKGFQKEPLVVYSVALVEWYISLHHLLELFGPGSCSFLCDPTHVVMGSLLVYKLYRLVG